MFKATIATILIAATVAALVINHHKSTALELATRQESDIVAGGNHDNKGDRKSAETPATDNEPTTTAEAPQDRMSKVTREELIQRFEREIPAGRTSDPAQRRKIAEGLATDLESLAEDAPGVEAWQRKIEAEQEARDGTPDDIRRRECDSMHAQLAALDRRASPALGERVTGDELAQLPALRERIESRLRSSCPDATRR